MTTILIIISTVLLIAGAGSFIYYRRSHVEAISRTEQTAPRPVFETPKRKRQPIAEVYAYVSRDYEEIGHKEALSHDLGDVGYKNLKIKSIKDAGILLCEQTIVTYNADIKDLDVGIMIAVRDMFRNTEEALRAQKMKYNDHIKEIEEIITLIKNGDVNILNTYEKGFADGIQHQITSVVGKYEDKN